MLSNMLTEFYPYITGIFFSPTLLLIGIAAGIWLSGKTVILGRSIALFFLAILWIFSTPAFSTWLSVKFLSQNQPTTAIKLKQKGIQAIVVLGGGVDTGQPDGIHQLKPTALDRLKVGIELSRKTGIPILVTGGKGFRAEVDSEKEAEISRRVAFEAFNYDIKWTESESRNTHENAINSKRLLSKEGISKIALVSHYWHIPRSQMEFQNVGFEVIVVPMGFSSKNKQDLQNTIPNGTSLSESINTLKEIFGIYINFIFKFN